MGLDPNVVDQLVALVREEFHDWASFDNEAFRVEERDYKAEAVDKAIGPDGLLLEAALREDLEGRAFQSFIERFDKIGHATNLLYQSVPMSGDLNALYLARDSEPEVLEGYCRTLLDLLWGDGPSPERLTRYLDVVKMHGLPNKWTLPTYFLFLTHPDEDLFIKPRTMGRIAKYIGADWTTKGAPTGDEYSRILDWAHDLRSALEPFEAKDMIDLQSLLWVAGSRLTRSRQLSTEPITAPRYWKIAPGEGAHLWDAWRGHDYISVGWDELGDLSEMTAEEWPAHRDKICAQHGWKTAGADQNWRFAKDIGVGDRIVANRGTSEVLGFGTVTGDYLYVASEEHAHRIPVQWDDVAVRRLPQPNHGFQRTLLELSADDFEALAALPIEDDGSALGPPFDKVFADRTEADASLDLLGDALKELGVASNDDKRFAITYSQSSERLTLDFGPWCVMRVGPANEPRRLQLALSADDPATSHLPTDFRFKMEPSEVAVVLRSLDHAELTMEIREAFVDTSRAIGMRFAHWERCPERKHHVDEIGIALLDSGKRGSLLAKGIAVDVTPPAEFVATDPAFTAAARDLLSAMAAEPTRAFYTAHKDQLAQLVQEPVRSLLLTVSEHVEPALKAALETERRLFSIFPKNDFGRGGAWPYYWGAFYPVGGKKSQGCQLYVFLDDGGFSYGFSIGNYASEDRKRFARNVADNRDALVGALAGTIDAPEFDFGNVNESQGGNVTKSVAGLDLPGWLADASKVGPHVHVVVPWHELLATEREQLVTDVTNAFDRLFPLVLLCTLDDPMPAIHDYLEDGGLEEDLDEELNPPYSLDDLADETSLPKENLESWLRAIERKGQAILYGPPGTGKTYVAERLAKHLVAGGTGVSELVQFHPAYAYEDFMQGMRPKARDGGGLDYPVMDGRFKQFCDQARGRTGLSVLIIDEVNRANLSRVFGELMYLLEYRESSIPLAAGGRFSIPANVRLIGTMNTADRSIALVDHALRRRFAFLPLYPDYQMLADYHAKYGSGYNPAKLVELLKDLNRKIGDHHYEVGTSFFMRPDIADQLPDVWSMEIEPYLEEYFFDQRATVDSFRWDEVKKKLGAE